VVSDETLAETLATYRDPRECADRMIELALRGGGPDNITCIVADVVDIEFGDDAPIIGGSVGDGRDEGPRPDSAAARASATTMTRALPRIEPAPAAAAPRKRSTLRILAAVGAIVLVLAAAGGLARLWVMQQYYVGVDGNQVTIFQGVRGEVLGVPLHDVVEHSDVSVDQLTETDRNAVTDGIIASDGLDGAHLLVQRLHDRMLPPCPVISATTAPVAPPPAPAPGQTPAPNPAPTTANTTPLPQATAIPGVTCRES
jgi:hypothetical protein